MILARSVKFEDVKIQPGTTEMFSKNSCRARLSRSVESCVLGLGRGQAAQSAGTWYRDRLLCSKTGGFCTLI